jgi:iron complex transport system substrate-binding protein
MFKFPRLFLALGVSVVALPLLGAPMAGASSVPAQCVVSLSPTASETLFAIGAGPQVQAVDSDSDFPTSGLPAKRINALNPSVEAVIGICKTSASHPSTKPDLVIISYDANQIKEKLTGLGVKVVEQDAPSNLAGAYAEITQLGALTGHVRRADDLVASLKQTVKADVASMPAHPKKRVTIYYELDPTYYSLTSDTFVGSLLKDLGALNVADAESTSADAGYPQLSAEYIASANPKLILLADTVCCKMTPAKIAKRAGFAKVNAVVNGHVVNLNDDVASRWGPRLGILMNELTKAVKGVLKDPKAWK